jgi:hypothetical protein
MPKPAVAVLVLKPAAALVASKQEVYDESRCATQAVLDHFPRTADVSSIRSLNADRALMRRKLAACSHIRRIVRSVYKK